MSESHWNFIKNLSQNSSKYQFHLFNHIQVWYLSLELVIFSKNNPSGSVVGQCNFTGIMRGPFQACYLGYNFDYRAVGHGYMFEALTGAIAYVFNELKLHRIMANYIPTNVRSAKLLRRLDFLTDGYSRDYLFIAGRWQDHVLTSLTNYEMKTPSQF
ncbi:GNAT family N-acetyltransferase [Anabaena lutea]|uniref:GNAT family N-acetyltransferase n=1 Tax=Anabaena lutea FACHB-196 TaxID=2692881 RepID=A0ABR8FK03_9NOST|nr:GNAT family N-acetyltransferase [Anabaena lutea FACHB-196]